MKFDVEELAPTKRRFKVEIPAEDIAKEMELAYKDLNKSVKTDGFRPGKTPRSVLERLYSKSVEAEVIERIVPHFYIKAVREAGVTPVGNPNIEEKNLSIKKGEPLSFSATVEIRPDFELADYKRIELIEEPLEVTEEEMSAALADYQDMHATFETVEEDRPAQSDDYVVIDFEGFVDGAPLPGGKAENYPLLLGSAEFIPGFEDQIVGAGKGEEREVKVTFPDSYKKKEIAGKDAIFKVVLKEIKKKSLPELDDDFAKDLGLGETVAELKEKVKAEILGMKANAMTAKQKDQVMKELARLHEFELPPSLVESEIRQMMIRHHQNLLRSGTTLDKAGFDLKAFEAQARPAAEERVKAELVLSAIAEKENILVSDTELEAGVRKIAMEARMSPQEVKEHYNKKEGGLEALRAAIGEDKALEFLVKVATAA